jgi:hypothetical protein
MDRTRKHNLELSKKAYIAVAPKLEEKIRSDIYEYIHEVNEWGLGVETIIDYLVEEEIELSKEEMEALSEAASSMAINRGLEMVKVIG